MKSILDNHKKQSDQQEVNLPKVIIYTDGSCDPNPGEGGWAAVLLFNKEDSMIEKDIYGYRPNSTNNQMELQAIISALSALKFPCEVDWYGDSQYCLNMICKRWLDTWRYNGWKKDGSPIKNLDMLKELYDLSKIHKINCFWVKGHNNDEFNEKCDTLAGYARTNKIIYDKGE